MWNLNKVTISISANATMPHSGDILGLTKNLNLNGHVTITMPLLGWFFIYLARLEPTCVINVTALA